MKRVIKNTDSVFAMSTIGSYLDKGKLVFRMSVHHGRTHRNGCYFKIYDGSLSNKKRSAIKIATKIARINFKEPSYESHRDRLPAWILSPDECKQLNEFLDSVSEESKVPMTNWEFAKYQWNRELGLLDDYSYQEKYSDMQSAYIDGYFDTEENLSNHQYLSTTYCRPDYTKLNNN